MTLKVDGRGGSLLMLPDTLTCPSRWIGIVTLIRPQGALTKITAPNSSPTPHKSSSKNLYANLKSAFRRFILLSQELVNFSHTAGLLPRHLDRLDMQTIPRAFVIKEAISSLLILLGDRLWFFVPLKPSLVLLVKSPTLTLQ